jgi:hypothetical protein
VHRVAVIVMAVAFVGMPSPGVAYQAPELAVPTVSLSAQLMLRVFGEVSDSRASAAAAYGDRVSESPLRGLALGASVSQSETRDFATSDRFVAFDSPAADNGTFDLPANLKDSALLSGLRFAAPSTATDLGSESNQASFSSPSTFTTGQYEPVAPLVTVSPLPGSVSFGPSLGGAGAAAGGSSTSETFRDAFTPAGATGSSVSVPATVRVGPLQVRTHFEGATVDSKSPSLLDKGYGAGANFDVRAGARNVNVDLSSGYERLTSNGATGYAPLPASASSPWQLPADGVPVVPNYAELSRVSIGAAVGVPVVTGLTLNLNYGAGRMFGGYGLPGLTNFGATDNTYGGKLTFEMPHSANTLSISARALHYQDGLAPANTFTQTREDVNFTVKF